MKKQLEKLIGKAVLEEFGAEIASNISFTVSVPPKPEMGDYATNVALIVAQQLKKNPKEVAEALESRIKSPPRRPADEAGNQESSKDIAKIEVFGGFINFRLKPEGWFREVVEAIENQQSDYGKSSSTSLSRMHSTSPLAWGEGNAPEKIMVEFLSPNTNKPLHLGHLRNGVTGIATINALKAQGHEVTQVGIINDRGVHICKAMLAYQKWGDGSTPLSANKKPDHFVGDWYVRFADEAAKNPKLEIEAQEMLQKWEAGDVETRKLWETIRSWVLEGWKETEGLLGFSYDKAYFESEVYVLGKDIVEQGLQKGVFRKNDKGNVVFDLPEAEFGKDEDGNARLITVLRPDGTSLYTTQDLGLAVKRTAEYHLDRLVYVVGSEQRFHFQSLFAMLKALGYTWAKKLYHLWYAMVYLPDGKMKSREGTVVDADVLVAQMVELARQEIVSRTHDSHPEPNASEAKDLDSSGSASASLPPSLHLRHQGDYGGRARLWRAGGTTEQEIERRAKIIALGAIKFYLLKQKPTVDIHFNPKESISFEGFTGPYCQYAYARARSILRGASVMPGSDPASRRTNLDSGSRKALAGMTQVGVDYSLLGDVEERQLLQKLESFPEVVSRAAEEYNPALIATHVFETAQAFNSFYTSHPVLKAESDELMVVRLKMVEVSAQVIKNCLALLGIDTLEEM